MAVTKIILDRQSDLVLTSPSITNPIGIVAANLTDQTLDQNVQITLDSIRASVTAETSSRIVDVNTEESVKFLPLIFYSFKEIMRQIILWTHI